MLDFNLPAIVQFLILRFLQLQREGEEHKIFIYVDDNDASVASSYDYGDLNEPQHKDFLMSANPFHHFPPFKSQLLLTTNSFHFPNVVR
jgi:hypothetical protein